MREWTYTMLDSATSSAVSALTPGEALVELFLTNADNDRNAQNGALVVEVLKRMRAVQALTANPSGQ